MNARSNGRAALLVTLFISVFSYALLGSSSTAAAAGAEGHRRALLIGVNEYKSPSVPPLNGAVNDVIMMKELLTTRFGFEDEHIEVITDGKATRRAILEAMDRLVAESNESDVVYIHFSGHGSRVDDENGDEKDDQMDETIVPHDGRTDEIADITDDEINAVLSRMKAASVVIVLDSCYSGTATRDIEFRTRSIPRDTRTSLYADRWGTRAVATLEESERYVLMTGAAAHEQALDGPVDGRHHGLFTFTLAKALRSAPVDASPVQLHESVKQTLRRIEARLGRSLPDPQFESTSERLSKPLFPPRAPEIASATGQAGRVSFLVASPHVYANEVLLAGGAISGAAPGSYWAIYAPGEVEFPPGAAIAVAKVDRIQDKDAIARTVTGESSIKDGSRAIAILEPSAPKRVPVRIHGVRGEERAEIENEISRRNRQVDFVKEEDFARFIVEVEDDVCRVFGGTGLQQVSSFPFKGTSQAAERLSDLFERSARSCELLSLSNPSSTLRIQARVLTRRGQSDGGFRFWRSGEPRTHANHMALEIEVNQDCYVTIVDVDSQGGINLLFPNDYQAQDFLPDGLVIAGQRTRIPDSLEPTNRAGFLWPFQPPAGQETIQVIGTPNLRLARRIREYVSQMQAAAAPRQGTMARGMDGDASTSVIVDEMRHSLAGLSVRGVGVVAAASQPDAGNSADPSAADWTAAPISFTVSE